VAPRGNPALSLTLYGVELLQTTETADASAAEAKVVYEVAVVETRQEV
jgi:hypothetical protein